MLRKAVPRHAPLPVSARCARHIDARFLAAAEVIPHRNDDGVGDTRKHGADAVPVEILFRRVLRTLVAQHEESGFLALTANPLHERRVVVRACVSDTVPLIAVRQVEILVIGVIGKLQHLHRREAALLDHADHALRHKAQVLRDNRQRLAEFLGERFEEPDTGALLPAAHLRGFSRRNRKVLVKAAEVIHAEAIVNREAVAEPL